MITPAVGIIICMALWSAAWSFFFFFMRPRSIDYERHFWWTAIYFLCVAIVPGIIFWRILAKMISVFQATPVFVLGIVVVATIFLYRYLSKHFPTPDAYFAQHPYREYLKVDGRRLISKSADILVQQVFIVLIVTFLNNAGLSLVQTVIIFTLLFGSLHVPLIVNERNAWPSWLFGVTVLVFSIIFPIIILEIPYGFVYTYLIHWLFYVVTAVSFCIWHAKRMSPDFLQKETIQ